MSFPLYATSRLARRITSISPSSGLNVGGTAVTIRGSGFTGATSANLGGSNLTSFTVVNDTTITGTSAAHAAGPVNVNVVGPFGTLTLANGFTYT